jgi:hypothetical protein
MGQRDQVSRHQAGVIPPWTFHNVRSANGDNGRYWHSTAGLTCYT